MTDIVVLIENTNEKNQQLPDSWQHKHNLYGGKLYGWKQDQALPQKVPSYKSIRSPW